MGGLRGVVGTAGSDWVVGLEEGEMYRYSIVAFRGSQRMYKVDIRWRKIG